MVTTTFEVLAARVLAGPPRLGPVRLVAVDGPTGSGKSTFASRLGAALRRTTTPVTLVRTDDLLAGWADTVTFWPRLEREVLAPLRAGHDGAYRRYSWLRGEFTGPAVPVPARGVVVLDGVTTARAVVRPELTLSCWLALPDGAALARAVARDGETVRGELAAWHDREAAHFAADATPSHADLVIDGAAGDARTAVIMKVRGPYEGHEPS